MKCVEFIQTVLKKTLMLGQSAWVRVAIDRELPRDVGPAAVEMFGDLDEVPPLAYKTQAACFGRDSGKTDLAVDVALYLMMTAPVRAGVGDLPTVAIVAPRERTARIAFRRAIAKVHAAPELRKRLRGETRNSFILKRADGREVGLETFAASRGGGALRGLTLIALILDEASLFRDESANENASEIYAAAMPRVQHLAAAVFTPWASEGLAHKLVSENFGAPRSALAAVGSTLLLRDGDPEIAATIELERERDEENATREFVLAGVESFLSSGGSLFFDARSLDEAIDDELTGDGTPAEPGERVGFGADIGLVRDSSALVGVGIRGEYDHRIRVLTAWELRPTKGAPLKLSRVVRDFADVVKSYDASGFVADAHNRAAASEYAEENGIEIWPRREGADAVYQSFVSLRRAFTDRRIRIPRDPRLLAQLRSIAVRPVPGGSWRVVIPRRAGQAHGDLVAALACAMQAAQSVYFRKAGDPPPIETVAGAGSAYAGLGRPEHDDDEGPVFGDYV